MVPFLSPSWVPWQSEIKEYLGLLVCTLEVYWGLGEGGEKRADLLGAPCFRTMQMVHTQALGCGYRGVRAAGLSRVLEGGEVVIRSQRFGGSPVFSLSLWHPVQMSELMPPSSPLLPLFPL